MFKLALFGPPQMWWNNQPWHIERRQPRLLLYRLAASTTPVPRAELAHLFWPEDTEKPNRRLTRLLSTLRHALPRSDLLLATGDGITLNQPLVDVDLWFMAQLRPSSATVQTDMALETILQSYRGSLLHGVNLMNFPELELWLLHEQPYWEQRYLRLLKYCIHRLISQANLDAAAECAQRYLAIDPYSEEMHRLLMEIYMASDQRMAALHQYERCLNALAELDIEPAAATEAAFAAVCAAFPQIASP
ncbi:MAG: hypothetical protein H6641_24040 [Caldilineaceae bacterium]|nr:hypothetical protein [Caldilineaceae bacterium]